MCEENTAARRRPNDVRTGRGNLVVEIDEPDVTLLWTVHAGTNADANYLDHSIAMTDDDTNDDDTSIGQIMVADDDSQPTPSK